jgi:hypothetical protein
MQNATALFNRLIEEHEAQGGREASIDFTVNGVDFTLSLVNGWMVLWFNDEGQHEEFFSNEKEDRERLIAWLNDGIGDAIQ